MFTLLTIKWWYPNPLVPSTSICRPSLIKKRFSFLVLFNNPWELVFFLHSLCYDPLLSLFILMLKVLWIWSVGALQAASCNLSDTSLISLWVCQLESKIFSSACKDPRGLTSGERGRQWRAKALLSKLPCLLLTWLCAMTEFWMPVSSTINWA